jgi:hypothetical protein
MKLIGLRHVKVKLGSGDDVERVRIVRETMGPDVSIRVDANVLWSFDQAVSTIRALETFGIVSVEEPLPRSKLAETAMLRREVKVPPMADESLVTMCDAEKLVEAKAADFFNIRISKCDGLARSCAHGFSRVASAADYASAVPIADYEAFRPYVKRIVGGEKSVLTADDPYMFTTTSGTTGEPKLLPVTVKWREQMAALTRLWLVHAMRDHPRCLEHKALTIVSPAIEGETDTGMPYGAMSGVTYQRIPWLIRRHYVLPYAVSLIANCDARYFLTMRLAMAERVSMIGTPNPSTLIRLARNRGRVC